MAYISILIAGYLLGIFSILILAALYLLHRPRYVAPTKRRANRDKPLPVVQPPWELEEVTQPIYMYGVTGEER